MTNLEKFLEVFGYEEKADNIDFQCLCPCVVEGSCEKCRHYNKKTKGCDIEKFWQSEYKEPKQNIFDFLTTTGIAMLDGEKIANAEWKQAINNIMAEIEAKNTSIEDFADTHGWVNGLTNEHNAHEADLAIITKHTKELL